MEVEKESSSKRPMDDSEALSEKKLQQMAKEKEEKKRKDIFSGHLERFKKHPKEDVKPEVKRIPKRPEEIQAEKSEPIVLRSRSPSRQPEGRRADFSSGPQRHGKGLCWGQAIPHSSSLGSCQRCEAPCKEAKAHARGGRKERGEGDFFSKVQRQSPWRRSQLRLQS